MESSVTIPVIVNHEVKRLITFIIAARGADLKSPEISMFIKERISNLLPSYMIPGEIICVDKFPVSANFKTDKNALLNYYRQLS
ncbi:D-alanine--poly(phosphoribitol) ligase subunit 1 [bioreactor metagenome]|uniref:D-alanine--poly(Phosphoribitol) ligase subunit 1 n=1 Tax=bioreactor metagenome TaxID=1076179 RepID=A0A644XLI4_9ZZZZ